jgi:hypothetical protein
MSNPPTEGDEILRAVRRIASPDQVDELSALCVRAGGEGHPVAMSGYFNDFGRLTTAAAQLRGAQGVYITLHPPDPAVLARSPNRLGPARAADRSWTPTSAPAAGCRSTPIRRGRRMSPPRLPSIEPR